MGVEIGLEKINREIFSLINEHLNVVKKKTFIENKLRTPIQKIKMYRILNNPTRIIIPFYFYRKIIPEYPNENYKLRNIDINFTGTLREGQSMLVEDLYEFFSKNKSIIIKSEPGSGKTVTSIFLSTMLKIPTLVTFSRRTLIPQWIKSFQKFTNAKILLIDNGKMEKLYTENCLPDVYLCMYSRISTLPKEIINDIRCVIFDEIHLLSTKDKPEHILKLRPTFCIGLSATPNREDDLDIIMNLILGVKMYGITNSVSLTVYKINTNISVEKKLNKFGNIDWTNIVTKLHESRERFDLLIKLLREFNSRKNKILILTSRRDFTVNLNNFINNSLKIKCDYLIGGKDLCQDSEIIIATYQKGGVGFDLEMSAIGFSGIKIDTLVLYFSTRMLSLIEQLVGRILRSTEPKVIDLVDDGSIFENHFERRMEYYSTKKLTLYKYNNS
jgi:superfamily II DNA or RNA helicase